MTRVKRLVLDVLKPHRPDGLVFSRSLAEHGGECRVIYSVDEVDERTESITLVIEGEDIQFERIAAAIEAAGGSVHSIDEVEVINESDED